MASSPETALYAPVKAFLEAQGFTVKGELRGCDLVALREGEEPLMVIGELKLGLSFELVLQAVDRLSIADAVWLAVPLTRRGRDQDRRAHRLCRLLGVGLLTVNLRTGHVAPMCEPAPYRPRVNQRKRGLILREFHGRIGDPNLGGGNRRALMTAYRQRALACGLALLEGAQPPRTLRDLAPDAAAILRRDVYGWFERVSRGMYGLSDAGRAAVLAWRAETGGPPPPSVQP